jgi:20S proteasome subunit beta 3
MVGKDCVAIACDLRLGLQALTVSNNFPKIFQYGESVFLGLTGLATDVNTVSDLFRYKVNMYRLREERAIAPRTFSNLVSSTLYERRFGPYFVSPVVAGLDPKTGAPFICGFDSIGCIDFAKDFIVSGTATEQLFGMCESLWEPNLVCRILLSLAASATASDALLALGRMAKGFPVRDASVKLVTTLVLTRLVYYSRDRTSFSRRFPSLYSTRWTEMLFPVGAHTSTSSRRTRSRSDYSRDDRIRAG